MNIFKMKEITAVQENVINKRRDKTWTAVLFV